MWQRAQTLYLAISTILMGLLLFLDKAAIIGADGSTLQAFRYTSYVPYLILLILIVLLSILALTTYKFRIFQMRTTTLAALLTLALQIWLIVDFVNTHNDMVFKISAVFPVIAIILDILAIRGILADEMMVRSADSLRKRRRR